MSAARPLLALDRPLFIAADLHLGRPGPAEERLARLLDRLPPESAILFLGDVVDFWVEGPAFDVAGHYPLLQRLQARATYHLKGNRDFLMGPRWEKLTGGRVLGDEVEVKTGAARYLCLHGDVLLSRDLRYQGWRKFCRSSAFALLVGRLGPRLARRWAEKLRQGSEWEVARKTEAELALPLAEAEARAQGFTALVCGHTHRPALTPLASGAELIALGAWDEGAESLYLTPREKRFGPVEQLKFD